MESSTDFNDSLSSASFNSLANQSSNLHLNTQSILPKIDLVRGEAAARDILIFTESWLKPTTNDDAIQIDTYLLFLRTFNPHIGQTDVNVLGEEALLMLETNFPANGAQI